MSHLLASWQDTIESNIDTTIAETHTASSNKQKVKVKNPKVNNPTTQTMNHTSHDAMIHMGRHVPA